MTLEALNADHFQAWRTPLKLYRAFEADPEIGQYDFDAFASPDNHLAAAYYTAEDDAFIKPWPSQHRTAFGNPPYSGSYQEEALYKAILEVRVAKRFEVVDLLMQASISTKWFRHAFRTCEIHLFHGRISFDLPEGMENRRRPAFSNALIRVRRDGPTGVTCMRSAKTGLVLSDSE